jgi:hypothetical protein
MIGMRPPIFFASRGWRAGSLDDWRDRIAAHARSDAAPIPTHPKRIVFLPEPSAKLSLLLVGSLHAAQDTLGTRVGPGWVVSDEPRSPGALFGGNFDDDLELTQTKILAERGTIVGSLTGPGHARRPSYRDLPEPAAAHLVCRPPNLDPEDDDRVVTGVRAYPASSDWILEIQPGPGWIRITPHELARRCLGGIGTPKATHRGGTCPSLAFEGLRVER